MTPAQREWAARRRGLGTICFLLAIVAVSVAVYVLVLLRVELIGASQALLTSCGTLAEPVAPRTPLVRYFCEEALADHRVFVIAAFVVTALLVAGGVALKVSGRDPYPWH